MRDLDERLTGSQGLLQLMAFSHLGMVDAFMPFCSGLGVSGLFLRECTGASIVPQERAVGLPSARPE